MRRLMLGAAAIAVTAGCSTLGRDLFKQPDVQLQEVRLNGLGLTGGNLDVRLMVHNPNRFGLDARRMEYNVVLGDSVKFASGALDAPFRVGGHDSSVVAIPVNFTFAGIGAAGRQLLNTGGVNYRVHGQVVVGTPIGDYTVPFNSARRFNAMSGTARQ